MPLQSPNLDDRSYQDLLAEARRLIPNFTPEWTDHNDSDPGMALLQLFCWLGEQIIYRLNRVPEKNYVEFLRMAGVQVRPATPARTLLTIKLLHGQEHAWIPAGTRPKATPAAASPFPSKRSCRCTLLAPT
jgi:predicted phage baseplate assembly protein